MPTALSGVLDWTAFALYPGTTILTSPGRCLMSAPTSVCQCQHHTTPCPIDIKFLILERRQAVNTVRYRSKLEAGPPQTNSKRSPNTCPKPLDTYMQAGLISSRTQAKKGIQNLVKTTATTCTTFPQYQRYIYIFGHEPEPKLYCIETRMPRKFRNTKWIIETIVTW